MFIAALLALASFGAEPADSVVVDSRQTIEEALAGTTAPDSIRQTLALVDVEYYSFDRRLHRGQIVVHRELAGEVRQVFRAIKESGFPVGSVIPVRFDRPNNGTSMDTLNNTYGFHYRPKTTFNTRQLSAHSYGRAVDINPYQNPALLRSGRTIPAGARYDLQKPGTLSDTSAVVRLFRRFGWQWGGRWASVKDRMHFEKP